MQRLARTYDCVIWAALQKLTKIMLYYEVFSFHTPMPEGGTP
jgi:hypothetical protein